jgi:hypothetical protein
MLLKYAPNPAPNLDIIHSGWGIVLKSIALSSSEQATEILNAVAFGKVTGDDLMADKFKFGSDILTYLREQE